ncbi:hypothetical protein TCAL_09719 [Tigriopus californicus]|uniref:Uncharacterized protein n=1 Tax=Tigriopus californicus TaxID=6832 RepID=A0A553P3V5_TIGCA|nr:ninjurin-1-like isoform X1 [Tigriopus californicus]TRY72375.1 hypothetical protein TCAL_09719 [Tigriopus californicus]|eukprot:TCALIF_09719-PA protein Name:"Protein of unknown function" AED:0.00 eAED:0.00 QI:91/1/1/1/0/1/2/84/188
MSVSKNLYSKFASEAMAPDHVDESGLLENESSTDDADLESSSPVSSEFYPKEVHAYTTGKTLTTGVMDMALLVSNAGQLREAFSSMNDGPEYEYLSSAFAAGLLIVCLIIQLVAGAIMILVGKAKLNTRKMLDTCHKWNKILFLLSFIVAALNVVISVLLSPIGPYGNPGANLHTLGNATDVDQSPGN